ncbi:MAG TPA: hypothetical protein VLL73_05590, partial [Desulfurivibrionaceae bacterium]|nr:hypothetical protein [Desulfurivibrionaceae bacterium]
LVSFVATVSVASLLLSAWSNQLASTAWRFFPFTYIRHSNFMVNTFFVYRKMIRLTETGNTASLAAFRLFV